MGLIILQRALADKAKVAGIPNLEVVGDKNINLGDVSMANGKVAKNFYIKNSGKGNLIINEIVTSCMCTTAQLITSRKTSPEFGMVGMGGAASAGWSQEILPGEQATLAVTFDPNAHGPDAVGPIERVVSVSSNDPNNPEFKFTFEGVVTH